MQVPGGSTFGWRLQVIWRQNEERIGGKISQEAVVEGVTMFFPGVKKVTPASVSRWKSGSVPDLPTIAALAHLFRADPGWLAFGDLSKAPKPEGLPVFETPGAGGNIVSEELRTVYSMKFPPRVTPSAAAAETIAGAKAAIRQAAKPPAQPTKKGSRRRRGNEG
jgi:transcriptional regulator with XRE-family HTH domain